MTNQKLESELQLSLSLSPEDRADSPVLGTGYTPSTDRWRLILLHNGSLENVQAAVDFSFIPLLGNYAIIDIAASEIPALLSFPQILYLELSRPLYTDAITGIDASCLPVYISPSTGYSFGDFSDSALGFDTLRGRGVLIGILDSGVDYRHPDFCTSKNQTRILSYWDQSLEYDGRNRYGFGYVFSANALNTLLSDENIDGPRPSADASGHGTHIAGICAGNGRNSGGRNQGVAPEASLLVVKLKNEGTSVFTDYANLMMAIDYAVRFAGDAGLPLSMNISYGSNDGSHDGRGLLERFISKCIFYGKNTVTIATGNEGISKRHTEIRIRTGETKVVDISVSPNERSLYLQLWKSYTDQLSYRLIAPTASQALTISGSPGIQSALLGANVIQAILSEPTPYQSLQELFLSLSPTEGYSFLSAGVWRLQIFAVSVSNGTLNLWLPGTEATGTATGFLEASTNRTFTIPSTAENVISVSGYDSTTDVFASFSGRGFSDDRDTKPDLTAPAVNILSTAPGGGYSIRTGTSMAAPFVAGAAALLMQYGIVEGHDAFLYGEKVKAYLRHGARRLPGFTIYPNAEVGYGALCVRESLQNRKNPPAIF